MGYNPDFLSPKGTHNFVNFALRTAYNMKNHFFLGAALAAFAIFVFWMGSYSYLLGPGAVLFFLLLALGFSTSENWSRLAYTAWIMVAVAASLFYPAPFREIGGFNLSRLIVPLLMLIMFGMGTAMNVRDFVGVPGNQNVIRWHIKNGEQDQQQAAIKLPCFH